MDSKDPLFPLYFCKFSSSWINYLLAIFSKERNSEAFRTIVVLQEVLMSFNFTGPQETTVSG